ncbi:hypothetical protein O181_107536, partial [Austropuccinia psidii MF-1]|nr:hypothetical protein [Austropuccinia psidii MF-1]
EQWDEEKEKEAIETVLKVVLPAYHQYLKVFFKEKEEKLPPHHTCDHHIKLEGSLLPSISVIKEAFTTAPILSHFNPSLPTIVEPYAYHYALGAVLSQVDDSGKHPIAFNSLKLLPAGFSSEIHYKELLGIVWALKLWRAFLLSLSNYFEVFTDHSSLQYFMSAKALTCCQARWAEVLSEFHYTITYRLGRLATLPDAVSHRESMYPEGGLNSSARILKILIRFSSRMKFKSKDFSQLRLKYSQT